MFSSPRTDWGRGERQDIQSSDFARNNHTKESYVATPAPSLVDEGDQRTKGRVLVAEDKALIRLDIRSVLERRGWEICGEARDGREAVRLASDLRPDVTLIDVRMPGLDGVEATRLIQRERETPVVMMAAYDRPSLVARSISRGCDVVCPEAVRRGCSRGRDRSQFERSEERDRIPARNGAHSLLAKARRDRCDSEAPLRDRGLRSDKHPEPR